MISPAESEARVLLRRLLDDLSPTALAAAIEAWRALPLNQPHPDDDPADFSPPEFGCPYCGTASLHHPSCLASRAATLLATPPSPTEPDTAPLDLLLAFVLGNSQEGQLWGGVHHDGTSWLCAFCHNWGNVYVTEGDKDQHRSGCAILLAHAFLQRTGAAHPTWPWRWRPPVESDWSCSEGRWERLPPAR